MDENTIEKLLMIKAMEFIARRVRCGECFNNWNYIGIPNGLIISDDLNIFVDDDKRLEYFLNDENFADLMDSFLYLMYSSYFDLGLSCANVNSKAKHNQIPN